MRIYDSDIWIGARGALWWSNDTFTKTSIMPSKSSEVLSTSGFYTVKNVLQAQLQEEWTNLNITIARTRIQQQHMIMIIASSKNVSLIRWYLPLNSFHRWSSSQMPDNFDSSFLTAYALSASSSLRCSFRHAYVSWMVPEIWRFNFGSQTKEKKHATKKQNILQFNPYPHRNELKESLLLPLFLLL